MLTLDEILDGLGERFGVLVERSASRLVVFTRKTDVALGDFFLLPCQPPQRVYLFRSTGHINPLRRTAELQRYARKALDLPGSYLSADLDDVTLLELPGVMLGYTAWDPDAATWMFDRPRRLPLPLSDVYLLDPRAPAVQAAARTLLHSQLGGPGLLIGHLLAGGEALDEVPVCIPPGALCQHIGVFGGRRSGKTLLIAQLLCSVRDFNRAAVRESAHGPRASIFALSSGESLLQGGAPAATVQPERGEANAVSGQRASTAPVCYLLVKDGGDEVLELPLHLSRADLIPDDLASAGAWTEQQLAFALHLYALYGEQWIGHLLLGDIERGADASASVAGTSAAVRQRLSFLRHGATRLFTRYDPEAGLLYASSLPDILCALERGCVITAQPAGLSGAERLLLTTILARVLFALRSALCCALAGNDLPTAIRQALGNVEEAGVVGMRSLADALVTRLQAGDLPYLDDGGHVRAVEALPPVTIVVDGAERLLAPERLQWDTCFRDLCRQGPELGIGLTIVSQQRGSLDQDLLAQLATEVTMAPGDESHRGEASRLFAAGGSGHEQELQMMGCGQGLLSTLSRKFPLPIQIPIRGKCREDECSLR